MQIVLATRNKGKIRELERILAVTLPDVELLGTDSFPELSDIEETEDSFEGNALLKARAVATFTQLPAIADDSGLCVDALNGAPGIFSARYAGVHGDDQANNLKLLKELESRKFKFAEDSKEAGKDTNAAPMGTTSPMSKQNKISSSPVKGKK